MHASRSMRACLCARNRATTAAELAPQCAHGARLNNLDLRHCATGAEIFLMQNKDFLRWTPRTGSSTCAVAMFAVLAVVQVRAPTHPGEPMTITAVSSPLGASDLISSAMAVERQMPVQRPSTELQVWSNHDSR